MKIDYSKQDQKMLKKKLYKFTNIYFIFVIPPPLAIVVYLLLQQLYRTNDSNFSKVPKS